MHSVRLPVRSKRAESSCISLVGKYLHGRNGLARRRAVPFSMRALGGALRRPGAREARLWTGGVSVRAQNPAGWLGLDSFFE